MSGRRVATIRPFERTLAEYARVTALVNAAWPGLHISAEALRRFDENFPAERYLAQLVIDEDGEIPALGTVMEQETSHVPGKYFVRISVHPARQREGLGTRLYTALLERLARRDPAPTRLVARSREDLTGALAMLGKHGYEQTQREPRAELDVTTFDPTPFEDKARRVRDAGVEIVPLSKLMARDPDWEDRLYDLAWELRRDVPSVDSPTRVPRDAWRRFLEMPSFLPEGNMIALDGDRWIGLSALRKPDARGVLHQSLTGVTRDYRRRGIATALKLRTIAFARDHGATTIMTANDENNPMYTLNLALGFEPRPAWLSFGRSWDGALLPARGE